MILLYLALLFLQDPAPTPEQPPTPPPQEPEKPTPPPRSREDRLEGRIASDPAAKPELEAPAAAKPIDEPAPPKPPVNPRLKLNSCALIVNEEPVTMLDLQRGVQRRIRDQKRPASDAEAMFNEELADRARALLEIQGGKDLGFDPAQVERIVRAQMERQTEDMGSVTRLALELKRDDMDSFERKDEWASYVNRRLWEESVTGKSPSPGGRVSNDRYVRPGWAQLVQRQAAREQSKNRTVQVTQLALGLEAPGSVERAKKRLEDLRARIEQGEDMGELAEQFGGTKKGTRGLSDFMIIEGLRITNPDAAAFLDKAEVGELSPVLDFFDKAGNLAGYMVLRPEEFKLVPVEPFDEPEGQRGWVESQRNRIQDWRINNGLSDLLQAAYVWPPNVFRAPATKQ